MSMQRTGTDEQADKARSLFDADTAGWLTVNPHTIANMKFALVQYVRYGEEESLRKMVAHYYKPDYVDGVVEHLKRIARSAQA